MAGEEETKESGTQRTRFYLWKTGAHTDTGTIRSTRLLLTGKKEVFNVRDAVVAAEKRRLLMPGITVWKTGKDYKFHRARLYLRHRKPSELEETKLGRYEDKIAKVNLWRKTPGTETLTTYEIRRLWADD